MSTNTFILGQRRYQVTAPAVVAVLTNGGESYVYRNGLLPAGTMQSQIEMLLKSGMIVELQAVAA